MAPPPLPSPPRRHHYNRRYRHPQTPLASYPPLMHLHTEDRPNKVINQRPIVKWFAGRLKPLRAPPRVNSPTCCGARYPLSSADTGAAFAGHPDINIYPASLHCRGTNSLNISVYICLYLARLGGKLTAVVIRRGLSRHPEGHRSYRERGGDNLNIALNVGLWTAPLPIHFASSIMKLPPTRESK